MPDVGLSFLPHPQILQQAQIFPLALVNHAGNQIDERHEVFPVSGLDRFQVIGADDRGNDGDGIARLQQGKVHQQPCRAPVSVREGMDVHQPGMEHGGELDRVTRGPKFGNIRKVIRVRKVIRKVIRVRLANLQTLVTGGKVIRVRLANLQTLVTGV